MEITRKARALFVRTQDLLCYAFTAVRAVVKTDTETDTKMSFVSFQTQDLMSSIFSLDAFAKMKRNTETDTWNESRLLSNTRCRVICFSPSTPIFRDEKKQKDRHKKQILSSSEYKLSCHLCSTFDGFAVKWMSPTSQHVPLKHRLTLSAYTFFFSLCSSRWRSSRKLARLLAVRNSRRRRDIFTCFRSLVLNQLSVVNLDMLSSRYSSKEDVIWLSSLFWWGTATLLDRPRLYNFSKCFLPQLLQTLRCVCVSFLSFVSWSASLQRCKVENFWTA